MRAFSSQLSVVCEIVLKWRLGGFRSRYRYFGIPNFATQNDEGKDYIGGVALCK